MAQVIDFTAGLRERRIESFPQARQLTYRFHVNDRLVEVRFVERFDEWVWSTRDVHWTDWQYMTGGKGFTSAAEAAQDALNRVASTAGKSPLFNRITDIVQAHDAAMGYTKVEGGA